MDRHAQKRILDYLTERIEDCKNPRHFGEALVANLSGLWRYRVGDYRILCEIQDDVVVVLVSIAAIGMKFINKKTGTGNLFLFFYLM